VKFDVFSIFHQFQTFIEHRFSLKIKLNLFKLIRAVNTASYPFFQTIGIHHRLICPHTYEQNRTVELHHRYIVEIGLTLLGKCKTLLKF